MAEMTIQDLYKLFEDNKLSPNNPVEQQPQQKTTNTTSFIKVGDIVVAAFKNREFKGEVNKIQEKAGQEQFDIKVGTTIISVKFENILEHYPKNRAFDQKNTITEIEAEEIVNEEKKIDIPLSNPLSAPKPVIPVQTKPVTPPVQKKPVVENKTTTINPIIIEENKNDKSKINKVDDQIEKEPVKVLKTQQDIDEEDDKKNSEVTNFNETVKVIGRITHFSSNLKLNEVIDFLAKKGIDKEKCWYFITERQGEIHLIRNNEIGFKMYPFVLSFVDLKIKEKLTESKQQMKIVGNNQFSVISNIPESVYETIKNGLIALLSQTK